MLGILLFCAGVVASLAASWLLVSRLERLGERAGFSEAWLGLVAALAADAPEITSAVVALARGQASVGAGVVIGSNVFNLAALLGLAAVVAGWVGFHRRVVVLSGVPAVWVAAVCLLTVAAVVAPAAGLALAAAVLVPYVAVLGMRRARMERLRLSQREEAWKTAEILILRHQLAVLQRRQPRRPDLDWADRALLATLLAVIPKARRHGLRLLVTPDTIVRWHRDIVCRRWAARSMHGKAGRPVTRRNIRALVLRLARENPGYVDPGIMWSLAADQVTSRSGVRQRFT